MPWDSKLRRLEIFAGEKPTPGMLIIANPAPQKDSSSPQESQSREPSLTPCAPQKCARAIRPSIKKSSCLQIYARFFLCSAMIIFTEMKEICLYFCYPVAIY